MIFLRHAFFLFISLGVSASLSPVLSQSETHQWVAEAGPLYEFSIAADGVYRIPVDVLGSAGIPFQQIEREEWQLWRNGEQVPLRIVEDDGEFQAIEFVGERLRSEIDSLLFEGGAQDILHPSYNLITDTATYFLSWSDQTENRRIEGPDQNPPLGALAPAPFFYNRKLVSFRDDWVKPYTKIGGANIYRSTFVRGEGFSSEGLRDFSTLLNLEDAHTQGPDGNIRVRFIGDFDDHHFLARVNDRVIFDDNQSGFTLNEISSSIPGNELNHVQFEMQGLSGDFDRFHLSEIEIEYPAVFPMEKEGEIMGVLDHISHRVRFEEAFEEETLYLSFETWKLYGEMLVDGGSEFFAHKDTGRHSFIIYGESDVQEIATLEKRELEVPEEWVEAEYFIISDDRFLSDSDAVLEYAQYRESEEGGDYQVAIVNIEDLYSIFGYGIQRHPLALREFAQYLKMDNSKTPFVFLIGKGREYRWIRSGEELRSEEHRTFAVPTFGYPSSDNLLVADQGDAAPMFPVGRLAVEEVGEVEAYLQKVIRQETKADTARNASSFWRKRALHLIGGGNIQPLIRSYMDNMSLELEGSPWSPEVLSFERGSTGPTETPVTDRIYDRINEGSSLVTFFGHSASNALGFNINVPDQYDNAPRHPFLIALGCYGGNLNTSERSVGEIYNSFPGGGFIGSLAGSGPGEVTRLYLLARNLYRIMGEQAAERTMGQMVKAALETRQSADPRHVEQMMYFGDPALKIFDAKGPDYTFDPASFDLQPFPLDAGVDTFTTSVDLLNIGLLRSEEVPLRFYLEDPNGAVLDEQNFSKVIESSRVGLNLQWPTSLLPEKGQFFIRATIDPEAMLDEQPSPEALENNELLDKNGQFLSGFLLSNGVELGYPYPFSITGDSSLVLQAVASNPLAEEGTYIFEVDTVASFDSPFARAKELVSPGGVLEWELPFEGREEQVYYWRTAFLPEGGRDTSWKESSFVYLAEKDGWNQSHIDQFLWSDSLFVSREGNDLNLPKEPLTITIQNRQKGGSESSVFTANGVNVGSVNRAWELVEEGIGICEIDTIIHTLRPNSGSGLYGSVNDNRTTRAFVYRTNTPEDRERAVNYLDSVVADHSHVFFFTIVDEELQGSQLKMEEWAGDTSIYGTSLIEALEERGAQLLPELEASNQKVYNFFYRQKENGFQKLEEAFLFSTEEALVSTTTMGRRLPEGYLHQKKVPLLSDSLAFSLDFEKNNAADSLLVTARDAESEELLWESFESGLQSISNPFPRMISLNTHLQDTEQRSAPTLKHLRIYQDLPPDLVWAPNRDLLAEDRYFSPDTLLFSTRILSLHPNSERDSIPVRVEIRSQQSQIQSELIPAYHIEDGEYVIFYKRILALEEGAYSLQFTINPERDIPEWNYDNNTLVQNFEVLRDEKVASMTVTFDEKVIPDGAIVHQTANVDIEVRRFGEGPPLQKGELQYEITAPDGTTGTFEGAPVRFDQSTSDRVRTGNWTWPLDLDQEGEYQFEAQYRPEGGGAQTEVNYRISFRVQFSPDVEVLSLFPNPTSGAFNIRYRVQSSQPPSGYRMKVSGSDGRSMLREEQLEDRLLLSGLRTLKEVRLPAQWSSGVYWVELEFLNPDGTSYTSELHRFPIIYLHSSQP